MTTPTITCDHCESEIDVAKDPKCVVYDPSGATDVICEDCRKQAWKRWLLSDQESWPPLCDDGIKRGWRA